MSSDFEDATRAFFARGEDPETVAATEEVALQGRSRLGNLGLAAALLLLSVTSALVTRHLLLRHPHARPATPLALSARRAPTPAPALLPTPAPAATPAPTAPPAPEPVARDAPPPPDGLRQAERALAAGTKELRRNHAGAALEEFRRALAASPEDGRALRGACLALDRLGRRNEAAARCRQALAADPEDLEARRTLARIYFDGGAYRHAASEWQRVLAARPRDPRARRGLRAAESRLRGRRKSDRSASA